jgi:Pyridoxamine 5'-phosphate oxidase
MTAINPAAEQMLHTNDASAMPWAEARERLSDQTSSGSSWLTTIGPDSLPHVAPVGALWIDDTFCFTMGQGTRKGKNLAQNAHCILATNGRALDFVIHGTAAKVTDPARLQRVADAYTAHGWPLSFRDGILDSPYDAPTTGPAPIEADELTPAIAFGFGTRDDTVFRATRWRF